MISVRKSSDRGHANFGWLDSHHSFSFGRYYDPEYMGFRDLRVINEDKVAPGQGFGTHAHDNAEIISYVLEGELEHKDSMGNGSVIRAGEFQRISAGTGITHSEFNPSDSNQTHFYQIWLQPKEKDIEPSYEQKSFAFDDSADSIRLVASPDSAEESLWINQDALIYLGSLTAHSEYSFELDDTRHAWIQILRGEVRLNGEPLSSGDGAAVSGEHVLSLKTEDTPVQYLLFDLP